MEEEKIIQQISQKYIRLFEKLLSENDKTKQLEIAKEISDYSGEIDKKVEKNCDDSKLHKIQEECLPMEHWKDDSGYCNLTEGDIKRFKEELEEKK